MQAEFVEQEAALPKDFECNSAYGASLSGSTYEERIVAAYAHGLLNDFLSARALKLQPSVRKGKPTSTHKSSMQRLGEYS